MSLPFDSLKSFRHQVTGIRLDFLIQCVVLSGIPDDFGRTSNVALDLDADAQLRLRLKPLKPSSLQTPSSWRIKGT